MLAGHQPKVKWPTQGYPCKSLFYEISSEDIKPEDTSAVWLTFKLEKESLDFMDHHKWSIRWDEEVRRWFQIPTKRIGEDKDFVYYSTTVLLTEVWTRDNSRNSNGSAG